MSKSTTIFKTDPLWKTRALAMLQRRIYGTTVREIAKEFKVKEETVYESLRWVKSTKLVEAYEKSFLELVPDAIRVYQQKLIEDQDPYVAKDILDKVFKLGDRFSQQTQHNQNISLTAYLASQKKKKEEKIIDVKPESPSSGSPPAAIEASSNEDEFEPTESISDVFEEGAPQGVEFDDPNND